MRRHGAHQVMELALDRGEVGEDVGVVELEVVEDRGARPVVDELRALVEERGVVLVGLDHEERAVAEPRRHAEVQRHAADQEAGLEPGVLEDPGEHRRRRRLAVRAGDGEHPAAVQHVLGEPLRAATCRRSRASRIASISGLPRVIDVADDEHVGLRAASCAGVVAFDQLDAERRELRRSSADRRWRRSRSRVAGLARERGDAAHERAADAEDVQVHVDAIDGAVDALRATTGR